MQYRVSFANKHMNCVGVNELTAATSFAPSAREHERRKRVFADVRCTSIRPWKVPRSAVCFVHMVDAHQTRGANASSLRTCDALNAWHPTALMTPMS
eukprot:2742952-Amphidinium_carterae.3